LSFRRASASPAIPFEVLVRLSKLHLALVALVPVVAVVAGRAYGAASSPSSRPGASPAPDNAQDWANGPLDANGRRRAPGKPLRSPAPEGCQSPSLTRFTERFTVPPQVDVAARGGSATLTAANGWHTFHAKLGPTPGLGYVSTPGVAPPRGASTGAVTDSPGASPDAPTAAEVAGLESPDAVAGVVSSAARRTRDVNGGPTLVARADVPSALTFRNRMLDHPLGGNVDQTLMGAAGQQSRPDGVVHLHGAAVAPGADGEPTARVPFGGQYTYAYPNRQESAGLWYHDHSLGMTRLNVAAGLAGQYWLRDQYDTGAVGNPLGLPTGTHELPLTLQDRSFNADGTICYPTGAYVGDGTSGDRPTTWAPEYFGDVAVVNGKAWPKLDVDPGVYRFRVLNASNARFWDLRLAADRGAAPGLMLIGTDGGLVDRPVALSHLLIAPGQRADLLVDFRSVRNGTKVRLINSAVAPYPGEEGEAPDLSDVMQFSVTGNKAVGSVPATLRPGHTITPLRAGATRTVLLNEVIDDRDPHVGEASGGFLNNQHYTDDDCAPGDRTCKPEPRTSGVEDPVRNSVEEWRIVNTTGDAHPIHLHLTEFQILGRQDFRVGDYLDAWNRRSDLRPGLPSPTSGGQGGWPALDPTPFLVPGTATGPEPWETGWHDTVIVPPGTVMRIVVPFGGKAAGIPASFTGDPAGSSAPALAGDYVWHCHILEHEDNDMMQPLHVH
jgi:spore coat protein A